MNHALFGRAVITLAGIAVIGSVITAILMFPPSERRLHRLDERRVDDLSRIDRSAKNYWEKHKQLPSDLAELDREPGMTHQSMIQKAAQHTSIRRQARRPINFARHFRQIQRKTMKMIIGGTGQETGHMLREIIVLIC